MGQAISGQGGRGTAEAYAAPKDFILRVESVSFILTCANAGGPHYALVGFGDATVPVVTTAVSPNGAKDGLTVQYSFGVGYVNSGIVSAAGDLKEATAALPDMSLFPGGTVIIAANLDDGTSAPNDVISDVIIYADLIRVEDGPQFGVPDLLPGLLYG